MTIAPYGGPRPDTAAPGWHAHLALDVVLALETDPERGLTEAQAQQRWERYGPNTLPSAPSPGWRQVVLARWRDPMAALLTAVLVVCLLVGQHATAVLVALLVLVNVGLGARQELLAQKASPRSAICRCRRRASSEAASCPSYRPTGWSPAT